MQVTGVLKNAEWDPVYPVVWGDIYGDTRGRFTDGRRIHTSKVVKVKHGTKQGFIQTLNSYYQVEWKD